MSGRFCDGPDVQSKLDVAARHQLAQTRVLGGLATQTDLPVVQIWIAGIALIALGLRSNIGVSYAAPEKAHLMAAFVVDR